VGAFQTDADALRTAILRNFVSQSFSPAGVVQELSPKPANDQGTAPAQPAITAPGQARARPAAANRPDLNGFAEVVRRAASARAEGWPGNRKAYISHVWKDVQATYPEWGLTEIEFKAMLAEAHRTGHIVLANADLKDKRSLKELQDSAVAYKNTVWHFIRVENG